MRQDDEQKRRWGRENWWGTWMVAVWALIGGLLAGAASAATTWHVGLAGSDQNPGTAEAPFATIQHAVDQAQPGDTVHIGPGTFYQRVTVTRSGQADLPITIQGTRGPDGQRLTRLDAGQAVDPATWEPAPHIGPHVYQNQSFGFEPEILTVDGRFLAHAHRAKDGTYFPFTDAMTLMASPDDFTVPAGHGKQIDLPFWETVGGLYAFDPDDSKQTTYVRLSPAHGVIDPARREVAISDGRGTILIENASHIVIRSLELTQGNIGIQITGPQAQHNLVEDCYIRHGRTRILIDNHAAHNTVRNCHIAMGFFGSSTGAWGRGMDLPTARHHFMYRYFKYMHGPGHSSDDRAIRVRDSRDTLIEGNLLDGGLIGVQSLGTYGLVVRDNVVRNFSSIGLALVSGTIDGHFHDNVIYNCNINIRIHALASPYGPHKLYIYRNRMFQFGDVGSHTFCHVWHEDLEDPPVSQVYFYHNTLVGGDRGIRFAGRIAQKPRFVYLNNLIAGQHSVTPIMRFKDDPHRVGVFDYNWIGGPNASARLPVAWYGEHVIIAPNEQPWSWDDLPDFRLPSGHSARQAGLDLSRPFTLDGVTYEPMPGMQPGYFAGRQPDIGAVQHTD